MGNKKILIRDFHKSDKWGRNMSPDISLSKSFPPFPKRGIFIMQKLTWALCNVQEIMGNLSTARK